MSIADSEPRVSREEFTTRLDDLGLRIASLGDEPLFTDEPQSAMVPMHWKWAELRGLFDELAEHLKLSPGSGRRTLKLANPGLSYGTTPTFWASIQYILPGEVATAHRHTPEAFRFVMYGDGCSTTVAGENYEMNEGDLVLTPSWAWHDHVHKGDEPMIWLDVLDISLVRSFHSTFFEDYSDEVQPIDVVPDSSYRKYGSGLLRPVGPPPRFEDNPLLAYPREQAEKAIDVARGLEPDPRDDIILEYQNPTDGRPVMRSMSVKTQLIRRGFRGALHRSTGSKVYWVISGAGVTEVGDHRFEWAAGDLLAIPSWVAHRHENTGAEDARLMRVDDSPALRNVGLYREETLPEDWAPDGDEARP